jgi:exodeoxyribonuclease-5
MEDVFKYWKDKKFLRKEDMKPQRLWGEARTLSVHDKRITLEDLSVDQVEAVIRTVDLLQTLPDTGGIVKLGGLAGTGKSTLIPILAEQWARDEAIAYACPTGRAINVLKNKLMAAGVDASRVAMIGTLHQLLYVPQTDRYGAIIGWGNRPPPLRDGEGRRITRVIVDEASMLGLKTLQDLLTLQVQVLAVGDHGQLPPINDTPILSDPDVRLETIHRQAEGSGILHLAHYVRAHGCLPSHIETSAEVQTCDPQDVDHIIQEGHQRLNLNFVALARRNKPRVAMNRKMRKGTDPMPGDAVICLRNQAPIFNGMRGYIEQAELFREHWYAVIVNFPDEGVRVSGLANRYQFNSERTLDSTESLIQYCGYPEGIGLGLLLDYGYVLTAHKAQGSAFDEVVLYPERFEDDSDEDYARWLYTAVTRAAKKLTIVRY